MRHFSPFIIPIMSAAAVLFTACEERPGSDGLLTLNGEEQMTLPAAQTDTIVSFSATAAWTVRAEGGDWLSIDPDGGAAGDFEAVLSARANSDTASRTATLTFLCGTSETVLTVTQNGVIYDGPAGPDEPEEPEGSLIKTITVTGDGGNDTYVYSFTYDGDSRVISIEGVNTYQEGYDEITDRYLYGITYLDGSIEISGEGGDYGETYIETMKAMLDGEGRAVSMDYSSIDDDGYIYIRGRSKNMILGPSGQNIYPEEIEQQLNNMPYVSESLIVEENNRLVALIYPDVENGSKQGMTFDDLANLMKENITSLNKDLPGYSQIENVKVLHEEFEKTPKRSIKRYLYQH